MQIPEIHLRNCFVNRIVIHLYQNGILHNLFIEIQRKLQLLLIKLPKKHTIDLTNTQEYYYFIQFVASEQTFKALFWFN